MGEQLHPQQPSHDDTIRKKCWLRDFNKPPNQNSIDISNADIESFNCRKLKIMGAEGMFILVLPERTQA